MKTISALLLSFLLFQGAPGVDTGMPVVSRESYLINKILNYGPTSGLSKDIDLEKIIPKKNLMEALEQKAVEIRLINRSAMM